MDSIHTRIPALVDTTLREGEQTLGIAFSAQSKIEYAQIISRIGVPEIEVGTPAMGEEEKETIQEILALDLNSRILSWNRTVESDIQNSIDTGIRSLYISSPVSDIQIRAVAGKSRDYILDSFKNSIAFARDHADHIVCGLQDVTRSDPSFLRKVIEQLEESGANRIRLSDTVGLLTPAKTTQLVNMVRKWTDLDIEIHTHNDFGLATANTLAAYEAGSTHLDVTFLGLGERAGNARIEEVVMALETLYNVETGIDKKEMVSFSHYLSQTSGFFVSPTTPVIGENVFAHESGIHVRGVLRNPQSYEPFPPEAIGASRKINTGKHSGRFGIKWKLEKMGHQISNEEADTLLKIVRNKASELGRGLTDNELLQLFTEFCE